MKLVQLIEFLRNRLKAVIWVSVGVLGLVVLVDALFVEKAHHAHTKIEHFPAFWSVFGFVACVLIIILSKWFGHAGIMVREDYYERKPEEQAEVSQPDHHGHGHTH